MIDTSRLRAAMRKIGAERGDFWLLGMFMRTDAPGAWELIASAPWLENGKLKALNEFIHALGNEIGVETVQQFRRIGTLPPNSEFLHFLLKNFPLEGGELHAHSTDLLARGIQDAIIFRSKKTAAHVGARKRA